MTIQEKLHSFDHSEPKIHLFHEGVFAKLYNESAYMFTRYFRRYKVNVTQSKRGRYYSLGFPFPTLDTLMGGESGWSMTEISSDYRIYASLDSAFDEQEYAAWCNEADMAAAQAETNKTSGTAKASCRDGVVARTEARSDLPLSAGTAMPVVAAPAANADSLQAIVADILRFRLDSATPLECMLFLQAVQKRCYGALPESAGI